MAVEMAVELCHWVNAGYAGYAVTSRPGALAGNGNEVLVGQIGTGLLFD